MEIWTHDNSSSGLNLRVLFSDFILDLGTVVYGIGEAGPVVMVILDLPQKLERLMD